MKVLAVFVKDDEVFIEYDQRGKIESVSWGLAFVAHDSGFPVDEESARQWAMRRFIRLLDERQAKNGILYNMAEARAELVRNGWKEVA